MLAKFKKLIFCHHHSINLLWIFHLTIPHKHLFAILLLQLKASFQIYEVSDVVHDFVYLGLIEHVFALDITLVYVILAAGY